MYTIHVYLQNRFNLVRYRVSGWLCYAYRFLWFKERLPLHTMTTLIISLVRLRYRNFLYLLVA